MYGFSMVSVTDRYVAGAFCLNYVMFEGLLRNRWREIFDHNLRNHRREYLLDCGLDRIECDEHQEVRSSLFVHDTLTRLFRAGRRSTTTACSVTWRRCTTPR